MSFAIELNERQSNRILEQAMRRQADVMLETKLGTEKGPIIGEIAQGQANTIGLKVKSEPDVLLDSLIGVFAEGYIHMGECRYLFSTHIIDVAPDGRHGRLIVARPQALMVLQRRRFWRTQYAESSNVEITYEAGPLTQTVIGALCNISPGGMAVRLKGTQADGLLIGETVRTRFELPNLGHVFKFDAVLCNKTPGAEALSVLLGLQFANLDRDEQSSILLRSYLHGENRTTAGREAGE